MDAPPVISTRISIGHESKGTEASVTKARCSHRAPWYVLCPWCKSEAESAAYDEGDMSRYPFWRAMTPADAEAYINRAAAVIRLRKLIGDSIYE